jgi:hypothetical protein
MSKVFEKLQMNPTNGAALVIAVAAFIVAVSGSATASPKHKIHADEIAPGAVTAKAIKGGAVTSPKLRKGAVVSSKLGKGSVTSTAIAGGAVTGGAIAPGSVGATQLAEEELVTQPIKDLDTVAHNGESTASNAEVAACPAGAKVMGGGFAIPNPNNGEASWMQMLPYINGANSGVQGRLQSDAGGAANGEVIAICLKPAAN